MEQYTGKVIGINDNGEDQWMSNISSLKIVVLYMRIS